MNVEIPFDSALHKRILNALLSRYDMAQRELAKKDAAWKEADDLFAAYIPKTDADLLRKSNYSKGKPDFVTIVVPYGYAIAMAGHTYQSSVFLSRNPIFQYQGRHGESEEQTQATEAIIDYQVQVGGMQVPLYHWLLDPWKYGYGIIHNWWEETTQTVSEIVEEEVTVLGLKIPGKRHKVTRTRDVRGYVGNKICNISPRDFFHDPRVPLIDFQRGEFAGHGYAISYNEILAGEQGGVYYNSKFCKGTTQNTTFQGSTDNPEVRGNIPIIEQNWLETQDFPNENHSQITISITLTPQEWGLGDGKKFEKWVFTIIDRRVIIMSRPRGELHNRFPYDIQQYEVNAYDYTSRGMLEMIDPLNKVLSWTVNSRLANIRNSLANQWVIDPSKISMTDFERGGPGLAVRLKPSAYGTDVRSALMQFPVMDVTQGNFQDFKLVTEIIQRAFGVNENIMGSPASGGRKTWGEIRSANTSSINRLKTQTEYNSALGWSPFSQVLVQNSQQYYQSQENFQLTVRLVGDLVDTIQDAAQRYRRLDAESIAGFYDFVPVDGTLPVDRFAQAMLWKDLIFGMQKAGIAQAYNMPNLFAWVARLAGAKEINRFKLQVLPPGAAPPAGAMNIGALPGAGATPPGNAIQPNISQMMPNA